MSIITLTSTLWSNRTYSTGQALSPAYRQTGVKGRGGNNLIIRNSFSIVFEKPGFRGLVLEVGENLNLHYSVR